MARIKIELPERFVFETEIAVRISDINYGGHLGNDAILSIAHEARIRFLADLGYSEKNIENISIILSDAAIVFRSESYYGDVLLISIAVGEFSSRGFELIYRMSRKEDRKEIARVKTGQVFFDYKTKKISQVPEAFRKRFL
jgi:4-hydroxybenzoyl-CoA thioesterase